MLSHFKKNKKNKNKNWIFYCGELKYDDYYKTFSYRGSSNLTSSDGKFGRLPYGQSTFNPTLHVKGAINAAFLFVSMLPRGIKEIKLTCTYIFNSNVCLSAVNYVARFRQNKIRKTHLVWWCWNNFPLSWLTKNLITERTKYPTRHIFLFQIWHTLICITQAP
jgi:hypothetical protein